MVSKILHWTGLLACIALLGCCFLPWAYFADINQTFTGFYSYQNQYGKPGKFLAMISIIVFVLMLVPKLWAKRVNLFVCALGIGYAIKTYILFASCYNAYCPAIKPALFVMMISILLMMLSAVFPKLDLKDNKIA
jgi:hypothetical protein